MINASIESQLDGTQNYYSQNYLSGGTLSTSGSETFFNSADVSGNLQIRDSSSGLAVVVQNASTTDGAAVVTAQPNPMGDGSNDDEWRFIPTSNGYYRVMNGNSSLAMVVQNASMEDGAPIIQSAYTADSTFNDEWLIQPTDNGLYNFVNRLSGLFLDVSGASTTPGTQLDQSSSNGDANQQFSLLADVPAMTTTALTSVENPSTFGQQVLFVATVSPALATGTVQFLDNGSNLGPPVALSNGAASFTTAALTAGTHNITAAYSGDASYLGSASPVLQQIVNPATSLIIWDTPAPITYGTALSATQLNATANTSGTFIYSPPAGMIFNAGIQTLTVTFTPDDSADFTTVSSTVSLTVNPAPLTVTAADASRQYGQGNPSLTGAIVGIQNGDNITATYSSSADPTSPVGTYAIVPTLSDPDGKLANYTVTLNNGTLTVTPAPLVATANNKSRVYGQPNPPFDGTLVGLLNSDAITLSFVTSATPASPVGTYAIVATLSDPDGKLGNYTVTLNNGTLTVTSAPLIAIANNKSRVYGQPNPLFDGTLVGVLNNDAITLSFTTSATPASPVGSYAIVPVLLDPTGKLGNYAAIINNGVLAITPAALVIAANNQTKLLDAPNPLFTVTYSGFVLGQGQEVLSGALLCATTAVTNSPVGTYPITCSGLSSTNYNISYVPGVLSIVFAPNGLCYGEPGHVILPPIAADGSSLFNAHRTVPAKFRVCDASGVSIGAPGTVASFNIIEIITAAGTQTVNLPVPSRTPDSAFRWDPIAQQWIFNINAPSLSSGATYVFRIGLADASEIVFQFGLR